MFLADDRFLCNSVEKKKKNSGAEIFSLVPLQFLMHRPFEKEFQIKSLILSKQNKKNTHLIQLRAYQVKNLDHSMIDCYPQMFDLSDWS